MRLGAGDLFEEEGREAEINELSRQIKKKTDTMRSKWGDVTYRNVLSSMGDLS